MPVTMQRGDGEVRAKMAELRMVCGKEIEIQQHRAENAVVSIHKSLQSIKSIAQETVSNEGKIGMLKAELRAVEDGLVKAIAGTFLSYCNGSVFFKSSYTCRRV
ncbi:hypothetical protein HanLR1_Chr05g0189941 [Helianthus annuus]|nr:hypothetical protein HanLR1_Chr05g0189941 [Helianthus annuus]